jgi:hypothetical protein
MTTLERMEALAALDRAAGYIADRLCDDHAAGRSIHSDFWALGILCKAADRVKASRPERIRHDRTRPPKNPAAL